MNDFESLDIDSSFIRELRVVPAKKLHIILLRSPQNRDEEQFTKEYDLQFNALVEFNLNLKAQPWLELLSHSVLVDSDYLGECMSTRAPSNEQEKLFHFRITCDGGQIDIVAETFVVSLVAKIPYFESTND